MAFKSLKNPYPGLLAGWKFLLSFRKREWSLEDYPIIVRKQRDSSQCRGETVRVTLPAYYARVVNWWTLMGTGNTVESAMEKLRERFDFARENRSSMPRPGTRVPLEFASRERIAANSPLADEFLQSVLGVEGAWISDKSSLWDFTTEDSLDGCYARIRSLYGVDASDVPGGNLADILEWIAKSRE
jgi:hypothetical protein